MGYALRKDGSGWRSVDGPDAVGADETYSETQPAPLQPTVQQQLQASAQSALDASDMVALRCFKAGVAFPAEWQAYVAALRAIVSGADAKSSALPAAPTFPAGT